MQSNKSETTDHKAFLPFSRPSIDPEDIAAVTRVLESGWITTGSKAAEFEQQFCFYTGSPCAMAVSSATAGMHLMLKALGIGPGDEVITPSMTWVSTVNLIMLAGATPVFADVDKDTLLIDPKRVEDRLSNKAKLIIPVHFAGVPVDMDPLEALAEKYNIPLIEDAAHAIGTCYKGRKIGEKGTSIFSFHPIKNITTGEGGMICSEDSGLMERIKRLRFHGLAMNSFDRMRQSRHPRAEVIEPGYKYNFPDMLAALGISQLRRIQALNDRRRALAHHYLDLLQNVEEIMPLKIPARDITHSWHLFIVRLDIDKAGMTRDAFMAALKEHHIGTGIHFKAVHLHPFYRDRIAIPPGLLDNTEWNSERLVSLPLFPDMTHEDVDFVVTTIKKVLKK